MEKSFELEFEGYYRPAKLGNFPEKNGVYCIYAATKTGEKEVSINRLLYIGKGEPLKIRLSDSHEKLPLCEDQLEEDEVLRFSYAIVEKKEDLARIEAALIYKHRNDGIINTDCMESFNYDKTTIKISGEAALLRSNFTVERTK